MIDEYFKLRKQTTTKKIKPKTDSLSSVNSAAKIIMPYLERAGVEAAQQTLTLQMLYRKAGIYLATDGLEARRFYLKEAIAERLGVYSENQKPYANAIGGIIAKVDVQPNEKMLAVF